MKKLTERQRFERAFTRIVEAEGSALDLRTNQGGYAWRYVELAWRMWQASARVKRQARKSEGGR